MVGEGPGRPAAGCGAQRGGPTAPVVTWWDGGLTLGGGGGRCVGGAHSILSGFGAPGSRTLWSSVSLLPSQNEARVPACPPAPQAPQAPQPRGGLRAPRGLQALLETSGHAGAGSVLSDEPSQALSWTPPARSTVAVRACPQVLTGNQGDGERQGSVGRRARVCPPTSEGTGGRGCEPQGCRGEGAGRSCKAGGWGAVKCGCRRVCVQMQIAERQETALPSGD